MRPRIDRGLLAIACLLAGGGWLCESDVDNPCPGAMTCGAKIANVCCPLGLVAWCDACSTDGCGTRTAYVCEDEARILPCSFNATIDSAVCTAPTSTALGDELTVELTGTLSGCGQESVTFVSSTESATSAEIDCGSWDDGVFGGCVSPSPDTTTSHWTYRQNVPATGAAPTTIQIERAHGSAPALASITVTCGP